MALVLGAGAGAAPQAQGGSEKAERSACARAAAAPSAPPAAICVSSSRRAGCAPPDVHVSQLGTYHYLVLHTLPTIIGNYNGFICPLMFKWHKHIQKMCLSVGLINT